MTQQLMQTLTSGGGAKQLIARNCAINTRPVLLDAGVAYVRGCVVYAADQDASFVKAAHGALPAATDVVAIVADDMDLSGIGAVDTTVVGYITGEFIREAVVAASAANLDAADLKALEETLISKGMNLVGMAYSGTTDAVV